MVRHIVVFDPGKTTGYCVMGKIAGEWEVVVAGEFPEGIMVETIITCLDPTPTHILYERFHLVSLAVDKTPIEVIGVIKHMARTHGYTEDNNLLVGRSPGDRYFAVRRFKGEPKHSSIHARAAINHAVSWLYVMGERQFSKGIWE